ncbi:mitochondrial import inner membrane translocase subunit PAM16 like 2-like [Olea europaea subsp. europaea]|uniref:Mitochondrial import inner membrane translocase subunit PAM16 like 2-like n=1 Tax=Olea europaea subsp. europaea TaxID=158383 RepID=A0A8S0TUX9_OLEEU|nr:mitochondrial import inner membrane translocase subunit PAM16 like 2-like [Olea europaea subsp. europaea]
MAAKILANLIVMGSGILIRSFAQAYRQALANASKSGVAQETLQNAVRKGSKVMTEQEARQVLGVTEQSTWEEILQACVLSLLLLLVHVQLYSLLSYFLPFVQKYDNLFERNAKNGSFYLQSKVHNAKECLEEVHRVKDQSSAG